MTLVYLAVLQTMLEAEITEMAGPKGKHQGLSCHRGRRVQVQGP